MSGLEIFDDLDERLFHLPTVLQFAAEWPWPDVSDYQSATTPLYHLILSPIAAIFDHPLTALRAANWAIAVGAVWLAATALKDWGQPSSAAVGALLLASSPYFIGPAVRLSTDNAALLCVFGVLWATHPHSKMSLRSAALWATAAVLIRQIHLWVMVPLVIAAFRLRPHPKQLMWLALPAASLIPLLWTWGALTPPQFAGGHQRGINLDALTMLLGVWGAHAVCVGPWLIRALRRSEAKLWVPGVVALCWALLSIHPMPWVDEPTRLGGALWTASRHAPELLNVPLTFWIAVPIGGLALLALATHPKSNHGRFLGAVALAFIVANLMSGRAYQKYYDPMGLFLLAAFLQGQPKFKHQWLNRLAWVAPIAWVVALSALSLHRIYG
jgi:hypothetical protein